MEADGFSDVDVADAVAIGEAEGLFFLDVVADTAQAAARHGVVAGVDEGDAPGFGAFVVHFHAVVAHVEGDVGHVQEVVGEVLLDHVALVAAADHEVVDAVGGVHFHDVPQDRLAADFDHGLGARAGFFAESSAQATGEDDCLHVFSGVQCQFELTKASEWKFLGLRPAATSLLLALVIMDSEPQA